MPPRDVAPGLPPIVALTGPAGIGKSTLARALARLALTIEVNVGGQRGRLPTEGVVLPLAAPLKAMLRALGVPEDCLTGPLSSKESPLDLLCGRTARHAMQTLGTDWGREYIHPEVWLRAWEHEARRVTVSGQCPSLIIVDDLRFDNERVYLERLGAVVVRLFRDGIHWQGEHASERGPATYHAGLELYTYDQIDRSDGRSIKVIDGSTRTGESSACDLRNVAGLLETVARVDLRRQRENGHRTDLQRLLADGVRLAATQLSKNPGEGCCGTGLGHDRPIGNTD